MNLAQVLFTVNVSKLSSSNHTKEVAAFYVSVSKYATKENGTTQNLHTSSQCLTAICVHVPPFLYMYICVRVASGLTNTSTPDYGPKKRQES
jgi:hypothetical protein